LSQGARSLSSCLRSAGAPMTTLYMEANAAEEPPVNVRRNGYVKASVVGVMGIMVFFGLVATYKLRGDVFLGNADADVALDERMSNVALTKKAMALQNRGDLFGGDKCPGFAGQIYANNVILDYRAPIQGTELIGYYKGIPQLCETMKKWDKFDLSGGSTRAYVKGSRMVAALIWRPTLKSGKKAPASESDITVIQIAGNRIARQDTLWANWKNLAAISGAPPMADNNPNLNYMMRMLKAQASGKFKSSTCFTYYKSHFIPTAVLDARSPMKVPGLNTLAVGVKPFCAFFGAVLKFKFTNVKNSVYTKGGQVVHSAQYTIAKNGVPDSNLAMVNFDAQRLSYYDLFFTNVQAFNALR